MPGQLRHATAGTRFHIPVGDYNAMIDAAIAHRARRNPNGPPVDDDRNGIVWVRNDAMDDEEEGTDCGRFAILGIDAPIVLPSMSLVDFKNSVALSCIRPEAGAHEGLYAILMQPLRGAHAGKSGEVGRAMLMGATPCRVYVNDEAHGYAEIEDGETRYLASGSSGSARILWKESGTGEVNAIVRFPFNPASIAANRQDAYSNAAGHLTTKFLAGEQAGVRWVSLVSFSNASPVPVALPKRAYVFAARYASAIGLTNWNVNSVYEATWYLEAITEPYSLDPEFEDEEIPTILSYADVLALDAVVLDQFQVRIDGPPFGWGYGGGAYPGSFCWRADLSSLLSAEQQCYGLRLRESGSYTGGTTMSPEFNRLQAFTDGVS